jgi:hypothetical protein
MTFNAIVGAVGLIALLFLISAARNFRRHRIGAGVFGLSVCALLVLCAGAAAGLAWNLRTYQRITAEQPAGMLKFTRIGYHQYHGVLIYPAGDSAEFELRGDEWQLDARVLKWRGIADILGFDTGYRLDRISGRYTDIDDERKLPRTVYALYPPDRVDLWELAHRHHVWLPWVDALYGSATFLPLDDGAAYAISVSPTGLLARPINASAGAAVGDWRW